MKVRLIQSGLLALSIFVFSPLAGAAMVKTTQEITLEARQFLRMANRVVQQEPTLYDDPQFAEFQKLTMKYQRYITSQAAGDFRRLWVVPPNTLRLETVLKSYVKYAAEARDLSAQLVPFVEFHLSLLLDPQYGREYQEQYRQVLASLWPDPEDHLQEFIVFTCDYTTQPTDGLWFVVHAMRLSDELGESLFHEKWVDARNEMMRESQLLSLPEIKLRVGEGPRVH